MLRKTMSQVQCHIFSSIQLCLREDNNEAPQRLIAVAHVLGTLYLQCLILIDLAVNFRLY